MTTQVAIGDRRVGRIGLGTNRLGSAIRPQELLEAARQLGVELLDTAASYGGSEACIGRNWRALGGDVLVATKGGFGPDNSPATLRAQVAESLARLRLQQLPLYFLHRVDPRHELSATMEVLAEEVEDGRIESLGLSDVNVGQIEEARSIVPIVAVQNRFNLTDRSCQDVVDYCTAEQIAFFAYSPLGRGDALRHPHVRSIASSHGVDPRTIALAWLLAESPMVVPIPATLSIPHLRSNLGAMSLRLCETELGQLSTTTADWQPPSQ